VVTTMASNDGRGPFVRFTRHATEAIVLAHHVRWPDPCLPHDMTLHYYFTGGVFSAGPGSCSVQTQSYL
jgi:hypothetical protein